MSRAVALRPVEKVRTLMTPEGVALRLTLGTGGERVGALAIDLLIMLAALGALTLIAFTTLFSLEGGPSWEVAAVIWLLGFFFLRNFYFVLFEAGGRAATPGKRAMKLRVASRDGGRLPFESVLARNLMRELELFLPLSFVFAQGGGSGETVDSGLALAGLLWTIACAAIPWLNRDRLRAGDFVGGSWVVRAPRPALLPDLADAGAARSPRYNFTEAQLDAYGEFELQTLEDVLRRDDEEAMIVVSRAVRARIGWPTGSDHAAFLSAYYAALRARLERGMLFGRRRRDKLDSAPPPAR